jgi:hypothetical protein
MIRRLNRSQKEALSDFFNNIAVAWCVALFATPTFIPTYNPLTLISYSVSMIAAIIIALLLRKE